MCVCVWKEEELRPRRAKKIMITRQGVDIWIHSTISNNDSNSVDNNNKNKNNDHNSFNIYNKITIKIILITLIIAIVTIETTIRMA